MKYLSCIIASYNEEPRIGAVLQAVVSNPLIDEIIVVDDGSVDETRSVVSMFPKVQLVRHEHNQGKSAAVYTGLCRAKGDTVLLLDADLVGLTRENITDLIKPVLEGASTTSISMRKNSPWIDRMLGLDFISGDRVFPKNLIQGELEKLLKLRRFGLEVFLNRLMIQQKSSIRVVFWKEVVSPSPIRKRDFIGGVSYFFKMEADILGTISVFEVISQIWAMRRLMKA